MSTATATPDEQLDSLPEDNDTDTARNVTRKVSALELINLGRREVIDAGARPVARAPSLRSSELTRPSLTLLPANIERLEGYSDLTKDAVGEAVTAMSELHQSVEKIIAAREASKRNPAWTEANQILVTSQLADKLTTSAARTVDSTLKLLTARITHTEAQLKQPLESSVASPVSAEIREYVRSLPASKRGEVLAQLIEKGDSKSLGAVLSAPSFLSGMTDEQQAVYVEMHNRKLNPSLSQRLGLLRAARDKVANAGSLFLLQAERAQGVNASIVARLKAAQSASEAAFR